jgi:hypothetical protein
VQCNIVERSRNHCIVCVVELPVIINYAKTCSQDINLRLTVILALHLRFPLSLANSNYACMTFLIHACYNVRSYHPTSKAQYKQKSTTGELHVSYFHTHLYVVTYAKYCHSDCVIFTLERIPEDDPNRDRNMFE